MAKTDDTRNNNLYDPDGNVITYEEYATYSREEERIGLDEMDGYRISTVYLGYDHSWNSSRIEIFETMIFWDGGGTSHDNGLDPLRLDDYQERYPDKASARVGHKRAIDTVRKTEVWR